ncbi:MAG: 30S ribosome-binding factor RbfA [Deltaproteobacteria bacterium]|jgi:ribosome-binding factor A|nr:30S ribosome-binding factor RbfA [Deltaproteobacteria bacterium]
MGERRVQKAASVIGDFVSSLFVTRISDPRLRSLTVTRAKVSPDMRRAYIYYSVLGGDGERAEAERALRKARGFVRANLASELSLRFTPEVVFLFDRNPGYAQRVMEILAGDPSIAALRAGDGPSSAAPPAVGRAASGGGPAYGDHGSGDGGSGPGGGTGDTGDGDGDA